MLRPGIDKQYGMKLMFEYDMSIMGRLLEKRGFEQDSYIIGYGDTERPKFIPVWKKTIYYGNGPNDLAVLRVCAFIPDELMAFGERYIPRENHASVLGTPTNINGTSLSPERSHETIDEILMRDVKGILVSQGPLNP